MKIRMVMEWKLLQKPSMILVLTVSQCPKADTMEKLSFTKSYWDKGLYFKANIQQYLFLHKTTYVDETGWASFNNSSIGCYWLAAPGKTIKVL